MDEKTAMLQRLAALDFAIWELHLYLDTHPSDNVALARMEAKKRERKTIAEDYEKSFGPLVMKEDVSKWSWIADPWPWEHQKEGAY